MSTFHTAQNFELYIKEYTHISFQISTASLPYKGIVVIDPHIWRQRKAPPSNGTRPPGALFRLKSKYRILHLMKNVPYSTCTKAKPRLHFVHDSPHSVFPYYPSIQNSLISVSASPNRSFAFLQYAILAGTFHGPVATFVLPVGRNVKIAICALPGRTCCLFECGRRLGRGFW